MTAHHVDSWDRRNAAMRKLVLGLVLVAVLAAFAYDYVVARPSVERAYSSILEQNEEAHATATTRLTREDVHRLLEKKPSRVFKDGKEQVEVFSWISGFPLRTHNLYVVYRDDGEDEVLTRHSKFAYDSRTEIYSRGDDDPSERPGSQIQSSKRQFRMASKEDALDAEAKSAASDLEMIRKQFGIIDADDDGMVTNAELENAVENGSLEMTIDGEPAVGDLLGRLDADQDQSLDLEEFTTAVREQMVKLGS